MLRCIELHLTGKQFTRLYTSCVTFVVAQCTQQQVKPGSQAELMARELGPSTRVVETGLYSPLSWVSAQMEDCYFTNHLGLLSLAIPPWVGVMSTGDGLGHC